MSKILIKRWISIMVETGTNCYDLNDKYAYLKSNGIKCKTKNIGVADMGMGMISTQGISLDVYYKDMEKAQQLLKK